MSEKEENKNIFSASLWEIAGAFLMYAAAYFYVAYGWNFGIYGGIFALAVIVITELTLKGKKGRKEGYVWLFCLILSAVSLAFKNNEGVWGADDIWLFMHLFAVWRIMMRADAFADGVNGYHIPSDGVNAFLIIPFSNFTLQAKTFFFSVKKVFEKKTKIKEDVVFKVIISSVAAGILFIAAVFLLSSADNEFGKGVSGMLSWFKSFNRNALGDILANFILSLIVGGYLFGLIGGAGRRDSEKLRLKKEQTDAFLIKQKKLSPYFWIVLLAIFSGLYLAFFIIQSGYLFGAFTGKLPSGFIVSEYARQGFFELCKITAVNFTLLSLAELFTVKDKKIKAVSVAFIIFLCENILFAVIAMSKLVLYISRFGFTPLRIQSGWLISVLAAASVLWIISVIKKKNYFAIWMMIAGVTLALTTLF